MDAIEKLARKHNEHPADVWEAHLLVSHMYGWLADNTDWLAAPGREDGALDERDLLRATDLFFRHIHKMQGYRNFDRLRWLFLESGHEQKVSGELANYLVMRAAKLEMDFDLGRDQHQVMFNRVVLWQAFEALEKARWVQPCEHTTCCDRSYFVNTVALDCLNWQREMAE